MATWMVEQIEFGLRLVDKYGAIAEPAAKTPKHAFSTEQTREHRERSPCHGDVIDVLSHRIDDHFQAVLGGASTGGCQQYGGKSAKMQERPPPDVVPEKGDRSARKSGDTAGAVSGCRVGKS
jgi:hypothetical protein